MALEPPFSWRTDVPNLLGLVLTVVGFIVTWRNQRKLREATDAAQKQALGIINTFSQHLALSTFTSLAALAQELRHAIRARQWERALDRAEQLRNQLGHLTPSERLSEDERQFILESIDNSQLLVQMIERQQAKRPEAPLDAQAGKTVDSLIINLTKIDGRLRNAQLEGYHGERKV